MKSKFSVIVLVVVGVTAFLAGVAFSGEGDQEKPETKVAEAPPPPKELEALEAFAGGWKSVVEFLPAMLGQAGKGASHSTSEWVLDHRFLMTMGTTISSFGTYEHISLMTYDPMMKSYRSFTFDNQGMYDVATVTHEPDTNTWTMISEGFEIMSGKPARNKTTIRVIGDDKIEWEWSQKPEGSTEFKLLMKGTDKRVTRK